MRPHLFQLSFQGGDAFSDESPVDLELGLAWAAQTHTAHAARTSRRTTSLSSEVSPCARKPRQAIFILRQLNLQNTFARGGVLGKDIQNQSGAVQNPHFRPQSFFQLSLVPRRQFIVKDDQVCQGFFHQSGQFLNFAAADVCIRVGLLQVLGGLANHINSSRV